MINRELRKAYVLDYNKTLDEYGQPDMEEPSKRECEVTLKIYRHSKEEDIRFNDVTHISLTYEKNITDANKIEINGDVYDVQFVNPDGRLAEIYLKKEH